MHDPAAFDGLPLRPYNVGPDALLFNFKSVGFRFAPLPDGTVRVITDGASPDGLSIVNTLRTTSGTCPQDWRSRMAPNFDDRGNAVTATFAGIYATDCGERDWYVSLYDHTGLFAAMFARLWRDAGGTWTGVAREGARATQRTRPAHAYLAATGDDGHRHQQVQQQRHGPPVVADHRRRTEQAPGAGQTGRSIRDWAKARGFDLPDLVIETARACRAWERISAQSLAGMLEYGLTSPFASDFLSSLPPGRDGRHTAKRFVNQLAEGNAYLKTGTLTGVKALAGYLLLPDGRRMLFGWHSSITAMRRRRRRHWIGGGLGLSHRSRKLKALSPITAAGRRKQRKRAWIGAFWRSVSGQLTSRLSASRSQPLMTR